VKTTVLSLILLLFAWACSRKTESAVDSKPQFTIAPADLADPPVLATNSSPSGANATVVIHLQFSPAKTDAFRKFTRKHIHQQTQLVVGSKVVAEPFILSEIPDARTDLAFSSLDEARVIKDVLSKK